VSTPTAQPAAPTTARPSADTVATSGGGAPGVAPAPADDALVLDSLLVEDVSIDGMCGVY